MVLISRLVHPERGTKKFIVGHFQTESEELVKVNLVTLDMMAMPMMSFINPLADKKMIIRPLHITSLRNTIMKFIGSEIMPPKTTP